MQDRFICTCGDVLRMLDAPLVGEGRGWWDEFFAGHSRPCPFLVEWPGENLAGWFGDGLLTPGRVLELGCGHGRNPACLAGVGCSVDAVDFSAQAIEWAQKRVKLVGASVDFQCCSVFDATFTEGSCDLVYDSGCFHHLPPHRRKDYAELVHRALKPGASYGLVSGPRAGTASPASGCMSERVSVAAWAIRKIACVPCGIRYLSRCACFGR